MQESLPQYEDDDREVLQHRGVTFSGGKRMLPRTFRLMTKTWRKTRRSTQLGNGVWVRKTASCLVKVLGTDSVLYTLVASCYQEVWRSRNKN